MKFSNILCATLVAILCADLHGVDASQNVGRSTLQEKERLDHLHGVSSNLRGLVEATDDDGDNDDTDDNIDSDEASTDDDNLDDDAPAVDEVSADDDASDYDDDDSADDDGASKDESTAKTGDTHESAKEGAGDALDDDAALTAKAKDYDDDFIEIKDEEIVSPYANVTKMTDLVDTSDNYVQNHPTVVSIIFGSVAVFLCGFQIWKNQKSRQYDPIVNMTV